MTTKYPSEIFGHPYYSQTAEAIEDRKKHWCPFVDKVCYKQSRLIDFPFGVCSAHFGKGDIAICPRRFLENHTVFMDIALHHFKSTHDLLVFSEVRVSKIGSFDFVMVKHKPMSMEIDDFVAIEFQTGQTTGTGKLVEGLKDFLAGKSMGYQSYGFGLNAYDIWKRTFTQVLSKGVAMEKWGHKIYWVVQEPVYNYFENRYGLQDIGFDTSHATVFALYDLKREANHLRLHKTRRVSASIDELFSAFRHNLDIPPIETFHQSLQTRIKKQAQISLQFKPPSGSTSLDVDPPTATGIVRERGDEQ
jgi:hypothetical protein